MTTFYEDTAENLLNRLANSHPSMRYEAALMLGREPSKWGTLESVTVIIESLAESLLHDTDRGVAIASAHSLAKIGKANGPMVAYLVEYLAVSIMESENTQPFISTAARRILECCHQAACTLH